MYKKSMLPKTTIRRHETQVGESIEQKVERILRNKEPIKDGAPLIFTERKDGVQPEYDIRTDRFEVAVDAMDKVHKSEIAKREERIAEKAKKGMEAEAKTETKNETRETGGQSIQGTDNK